jgi:hypothetical protein
MLHPSCLLAMVPLDIYNVLQLFASAFLLRAGGAFHVWNILVTGSLIPCKSESFLCHFALSFAWSAAPDLFLTFGGIFLGTHHR